MATAGPSLSVEVDLDVQLDGKRCAVWSEGDKVVINAPSLGVARSLLSGVETLPVPRELLVDGLGTASLTVELRVRHAPVASLGAAVEPSRLAALAGYSADVSLRGLAVTGWRRLL